MRSIWGGCAIVGKKVLKFGEHFSCIFVCDVPFTISMYVLIGVLVKP